MTTRQRLGITLVMMMCAPGFAGAQELPIRRLEVTVGGGWLGGSEFGTTDANLRQATPSDSRRLFSAETQLAGGPLLNVGAGFAFNRRWGVEGGVVLSHPDLRSSVSADAEGAPPITIAERIDQYIVEASVVIRLNEVRLGQRTVPFAVAGAAYLRQLHEGRTVVEHGHVFHVGGGVKHWLLTRNRGAVRAVGLRADARLYLLAGGIAFDDGPRPQAAVSGAVFVAF